MGGAMRKVGTICHTNPTALHPDVESHKTVQFWNSCKRTNPWIH